MSTRQRFFATGRNISGGVTHYNNVVGPSAWSSVEVSTIFPTSGKITNFKVILQTAPGSGSSASFTIRKASRDGAYADTTLSVTFSNDETESALITDEISISAGDRVTIKMVGSFFSAANYPRWRLDFIPTVSGETILSGRTAYANNTYCSCVGNSYSTHEYQALCLFPTSGVIKNFYVELPTVAGDGNSRTFTVRKNNVNTGLVVALEDSDVYGDDLTTSPISVSAGDYISVEQTVSGSPPNTNPMMGLVFIPDNSGEFITNSTGGILSSSSQIEYTEINRGGNSYTIVEDNHICLGAKCTAKKMYVSSSNTPGAGNSYYFTIRKNKENTSLTLSLSDSEKTGNVASQVSFNDDDTINIMHDTSEALLGTYYTLSVLYEYSDEKVVGPFPTHKVN